jgi:hypothetical protein
MTGHVWLSRALLNTKEAFGFSCDHLETAKATSSICCGLFR